MRSVCGPFRPPLRSTCGPNPRDYPRTRAKSAHETQHFAGIRRSPVMKEYRGARIRTGDLTDPNGARYQAAPRPDASGSITHRSRRHGGRPSSAHARAALVLLLLLLVPLVPLVPLVLLLLLLLLLLPRLPSSSSSSSFSSFPSPSPPSPPGRSSRTSLRSARRPVTVAPPPPASPRSSPRPTPCSSRNDSMTTASMVSRSPARRRRA